MESDWRTGQRSSLISADESLGPRELKMRRWELSLGCSSRADRDRWSDDRSTSLLSAVSNLCHWTVCAAEREKNQNVKALKSDV